MISGFATLNIWNLGATQKSCQVRNGRSPGGQIQVQSQEALECPTLTPLLSCSHPSSLSSLLLSFLSPPLLSSPFPSSSLLFLPSYITLLPSLFPTHLFSSLHLSLLFSFPLLSPPLLSPPSFSSSLLLSSLSPSVLIKIHQEISSQHKELITCQCINED